MIDRDLLDRVILCERKNIGNFVLLLPNLDKWLKSAFFYNVWI